MRPVALQDNLAKTQAAERLNQIQKAHGEMEQRLGADALKKKISENLARTRESQQTDMVIILKDQEKENKDKKKKDKKHKNQTSEDQPDHKADHVDLTG